MSAADFLVEVGTEELPPKALRSLMNAFAENLTTAIDDERLLHGDVHAYASPRRLAVVIEKLATAQEDRKVSQKGPSTKVAFDDSGKALLPAIAFAKKCGVDVTDLGRTATNKGEWLSYELLEAGKTTAEIIPGLIEKALAALPIPRRMRWGAGEAEFVRPIHWLVLLHGKETIDAEIMGIKSGAASQGHRFHSAGEINIPEPAKYLQTLEKKGHVIADFERRRELIEKGAAGKAREAGGFVVDGDALYDEVASLVEWPVPILGSFGEEYLQLPREVIISTLTSHQRYFPVADKNGNLLAKFVTIANLESTDPDQVRNGNERVIHPRLADAAFFRDADRKTSLASRQDALRDVVYQRGLGSLHDKSARIAALAVSIATSLGADSANVERAAMLCKCDLLTGMVGEFPELQGVMGGYYAVADGEPQAIADAITEHYQPRFAGDKLPASVDGQILALADKLDTMIGVFSIGKKPTGNRDPFALRRAALGVVRILIECNIDFHLRALVDDEVFAYIGELLRRYFRDRDSTLATETFDAVLARKPVSLVDFDRRLIAVQSFIKLDEAASLAAANKRIANILRKAGDDSGAVRGSDVDENLLQEPAELALFSALTSASDTVQPLLVEHRYTETLRALASLREPIDVFFDDVMVMADDAAIKNNRLALLGNLRALFLDVADISRLSIA
ncbi:MAG: glycine--tRNA ligase subunit beta [Proteobacteria bacterium]|nr:glycine--tRNA ligase subunit beta [Pseudomonadota bacterium]